MKGVFTISLDFELHWGGFEKWKLGGVRHEVRGMRHEARGISNEARGISKEGRGTSNEAAGESVGLGGDPGFNTHDSRFTIHDSAGYNRYFLNTREVIPQMLELFEQYNVHVTWATVGMLFHRSKKEILENAPLLKPSYKVSELSAYEYIQSVGIGEDEKSDPFHYAPSLVQKIIATPHQELGTHTFAHYYCNEEGQTIEQFREDLKAAQRAAKRYGKQLRSLVFPRNQFNDQYLKVCFEEGITSVRSNPLDWFWHIESTQGESAWKRLNRGVDAYFPLGKKNTYRFDTLTVRDGFPVCIPASRLLRPYRPKEFFLNDFKINRIRSEMTRAAKHGEIYHLWWHPHNFGHYPQESLQGLKKILEHYRQCVKLYNMKSMNMEEISEKLLMLKESR